MLHLLFDDRPWFRPKSRGYGTGLPIAVVIAGLAPLPIYRAKTEGGWRWR